MSTKERFVFTDDQINFNVSEFLDLVRDECKCLQKETGCNDAAVYKLLNMIAFDYK